LYVLEAAIRITNENLLLIESFRELANVKLESGKGSAVDLLRVEMDLAELINEIQYLKDSRLPIDTEFRELLNSNNISQIELPDTLITSEFSEGKDVLRYSIITNNPGLKKFDYEISSLTSEVETARKTGLPSFNIGLAYTGVAKRTDVPDFTGNGQDSFIFPQIGMTLPLYRKKYKAMVKEKELVKTSKVQEKEDRTNKLALDLEKSWRDYLDAQRRVLLFQRLTTLANQSLDILLAEYTSAGRDFEEILRMDRQLLLYALELEKARADQNTAVAYITYLMGEN
jgi:outer membrane protein TolC